MLEVVKGLSASTVAFVALFASVAAVAVSGPAVAGCDPGPVDAVEYADGEWFVARPGPCGAALVPVGQNWNPRVADNVHITHGNGSISSSSGADVEAVDGVWRVFGESGVVYLRPDEDVNGTVERELPVPTGRSLTSGARDPSNRYWITLYDGDVRVYGAANEVVTRIRGDWRVDRGRDGVVLVGERPGTDVLRVYSVPSDWNGSSTSLAVERVALGPTVDRATAVEPRPGGGYVVVSHVGNAFVYDEAWRLREVRHAESPLGGLFWLSPALVVSAVGAWRAHRYGDAPAWVPGAAAVGCVALAVAVREGLLPGVAMTFYWLPETVAATVLVATAFAVPALLDSVDDSGADGGLVVRYLGVATPLLVVAVDFAVGGVVW